MTVCGKYFCGNRISEYGIQNGYVDYATLAKAFDAVLANDLFSKTADIGYWEQLTGGTDEEIERLREQLERLGEEFEELTEQGQDISETEQAKAIIEREIEELEDYWPDIYQYFIVSDDGAELLQRAGEIVFYNDELDLYVWGVTHYGTSWDYVLTSIKIEREEVA